MSDRALLVLDAGPQTTVQDRGRPGWAHLGVPRAGALDGPAADLANRLVGNSRDAAVLETTMGGAAVRASTALTLAVTGAPCDVRVGSRPVAHGAAVTVPAGAAVVLGPARSGVRSYLAVAGGVRVAPVLGSRSTDTLAGVGPPALREGDLLPVGAPTGPPSAAEAAVRRPSGPVELRLLVGPRPERTAAAVAAGLGRTAWVAGGHSNRVALRLSGPALGPVVAGEVPTEPLVLGAVQLPASGQPLVFLADHPTTGGYPVVAVVHPEDLALCAQVRPGDPVRLSVG